MRRTVQVAVLAVAVLAAASVVLFAAPGGGVGGRPGDPAVAGAEPVPGQQAGAADAAAAEQASGQVPPTSVTREIVRTAQLAVEVTDPAGAARQVRTAAAGAGATVVEEQTDSTGGWIVLRMPVANLDRLVERIAAVGNVLSRGSRAEDVTEQVVDLDARVESQQASVARVRALLAEASSVGDVVAVESELARREAELDSLTARLTACATRSRSRR